jgi:hypothetical protein
MANGKGVTRFSAPPKSASHLGHGVHASNSNQEADTRLALFHPPPERPTQWQIAPAETVKQSQINLPRLDWYDKEVGVNGRSVAAVYALARDAYMLSTPSSAFLGRRGRDI